MNRPPAPPPVPTGDPSRDDVPRRPAEHRPGTARRRGRRWSRRAAGHEYLALVLILLPLLHFAVRPPGS